MARKIANVIALGVGGLAMLPFIGSLGGEQDKAHLTTNVRITVGMDTTGVKDDHDLKGNTPGLRLADLAGNIISRAEGSGERFGGYKDIALVANDEVCGAQGEYLSISTGGNNALCIAFISMIWPDATRHVWTGDM